jgi:hypothetical protein
MKAVAIAVIPTLILAVIMALLSGCSSTPVKSAKQYCHTSQEIRVQDKETVSSETLIRCNDDPIEQIGIKKMGVAKQCFEQPYRHQLPSGRIIEGRGYACQKYDGTWEVIDGRNIH